jgi:hypothetical protein
VHTVGVVVCVGAAVVGRPTDRRAERSARHRRQRGRGHRRVVVVALAFALAVSFARRGNENEGAADRGQRGSE